MFKYWQPDFQILARAQYASAKVSALPCVRNVAEHVVSTGTERRRDFPQVSQSQVAIRHTSGQMLLGPKPRTSAALREGIDRCDEALGGPGGQANWPGHPDPTSKSTWQSSGP